MHMPEYYEELDKEESAHHATFPGALPPESVAVMTVLLIGFQGQTRLLTGTRNALWNEYMNGDGGHGCNDVQPMGWQYWCPQDRPITELADADIPPAAAHLFERTQ